MTKWREGAFCRDIEAKGKGCMRDWREGAFCRNPTEEGAVGYEEMACGRILQINKA